MRVGVQVLCDSVREYMLIVGGIGRQTFKISVANKFDLRYGNSNVAD